MSYIRQNFEDGQTLTAEHLNHMEEGIASAVLSPDDAITVAVEMGLVTPVTDKNGAIFTDASGNIYSL